MTLKPNDTHFIEDWAFHETTDGTKVIRLMALYLKGIVDAAMLVPYIYHRPGLEFPDVFAR